jgi:octaprenyl-diphosphate synthase
VGRRKRRRPVSSFRAPPSTAKSDDLAEGKPTLPLLYAMRKGDERQRAIIRHAIEQGGLDELPAVMQAVQQTGALQHVRALAQQEAALGCAAIAHLPRSIHRDALTGLAEFAVNRSF